MKFLRLSDPLSKLLFENEDIIAVDKPYGLDSHTNEAKKGNEAYLVPGLIELYEIQLGTKLHIIHRLDKTTTGVIVFGKSLESARKYQQFFRARETKKTYVFVTASRTNFERAHTDQAILHKGAELEASTDFKKVQSSPRFEKWEAYPHTGRNHQIRIHGAHVGVPLLGDEKYGGAKFPFLCLHNRRLEFPNGVVIESAEPTYFKTLELLENQALATALLEIDRRQRLFETHDSQTLRLIHSSQNEERSRTLDQLGPVLSLSWYKDAWLSSDDSTYRSLADVLRKPILVRHMSPKLKTKSGAPTEIVLGGSPSRSWHAHEGDTVYELRADAGQSLGLFPDLRLHRNWVRKNSEGKKVLNLFCYTGGFSVEAALGAASQVTSVDTSKSSLNWCRANFENNSLALEPHRFLNRDAIQYLEQCVSKNESFALVICDAPSFSRGDKGLFKLENEIDKLLSLLLKVLSPKGELVFATHHEALFVDDIRKKFLAAAASTFRQSEQNETIEINSIQSSLDFELPGERVTLKSFLIKRLS